MPTCDGCKIDRPVKQMKVIDSGEHLCFSCIEELHKDDVVSNTSSNGLSRVDVKNVVTTERTSQKFKSEHLPPHLVILRPLES